ncbi:MAG: 4'-phosphopantetheinyl transferase superfamily protein [Burkholderiales bacterium]|jgi:phosphopantetheinyl transferase|nr:4'-phosphopantetheinyl transferase superfamily protein [Burkholderiales bacterium]
MAHHTANALFPKEGIAPTRLVIPEHSKIALFLFALNQPPQTYPHFAAWLTEPEWQSALLSADKSPAPRVKKALSRAMLRFALSEITGVAPRDFQFAYDGQRPILTPSFGILADFNLSHSGDFMLVGAIVAPNPFFRIGVDIELLSLSRNVEKLRARELTASENQTLDLLPTPQRKARFLTYWALKEAFAKAHGAGFSKLGGFKTIEMDVPLPSDAGDFSPASLSLSGKEPFARALPAGEHPRDWRFFLPRFPPDTPQTMIAAVGVRGFGKK